MALKAAFHVLIVEDSPEDRAQLRRMLFLGSTRRYRFTEADTGAAGVHALGQLGDSPPDCILLDYHLPDMNATEVLVAIRRGAELPPCPVVVLTGTDTISGPDVLRAGAQDYIGKSWSVPEGLTRAIENAVDRFALLMQRQRSEARERARTAELEALMDAIPAAVFIARDAACSTITGNRATKEILRSETAAGPLFGHPPVEHPPHRILRHGRLLTLDEMPLQLAAATGTIVSGVELDVTFDEGASVNLYGSAIPLFDDAGLVRGSVGTFIDITARRAAERALTESRERILRAQRASRVGLWEWHLPTDVFTWTEEAWTVHGRPPGDTPVTLHGWLSWVHAEDRSHVATVIEASRALGLYRDSFRIVDPDGGVRWIESRGQIALNDNGQSTSMFGTVVDATERKTSEITLSEMARRKDEFLAMLGHELRSPLAAIRHAVQIIHESPEDASARLWADQVIDRQSLQLSRMVDDLLDVARIDRGRIELRPEKLDLRIVLERSIAVARPLMEQKRHHFTAQIATGLNVTGDALRLEQVFVNLLNNAAKYTLQGGAIHLEGVIKCGAAEGVRDEGSWDVLFGKGD